MHTDRLHVIEVPGVDVVGPVRPRKRMSEHAFREAFDATPHFLFVPAHVHPVSGQPGTAVRMKVAGAVSAAVMAHSFDVPVTIWPADEAAPEFVPGARVARRGNID